MAVKRRTIWLTDEEWALLQAHAKEHGLNPSEEIRSMWRLAAEAHPATPVEMARIEGFVPEFRPAPKPSAKAKR